FLVGGRFLATGCADGKVRLWSPRTGRRVGPVRAHLGPVEAVAASADGRWLLSGSLSEQRRRWPVPALMEGGPDQLMRWAELSSGARLAAEDGLEAPRALSYEEWRRLVEKGGPMP